MEGKMGECLLDSQTAKVTFLNLEAAEPDIARVPVMVDSSKFAVIEDGLKCLQGKPVVNSISLKEGEAEFVRQAGIVRRHSPAVVVMSFAYSGPADTLAEKPPIAQRPPTNLMDEAQFPPADINPPPNPP